MSDELYENYASTSSLAGKDYVTVLSEHFRYFALQFQKHLPSSSQASILEVGCGFGRNLYALKQLGYDRLYGIDLSSEQIELAQELGFEDTVIADLFDVLPTMKEEHDCILMLDVLEHVPTDKLFELGHLIRNALKPGGRLIVQVPNDMAPFSPYRSGDITHVRAFTGESLNQFFRIAGLSPVIHHETKMPIHSLKGLVARLAWVAFLRPLYSAVFKVSYGTKHSFSPVFTGNIIAVAEKEG